MSQEAPQDAGTPENQPDSKDEPIFLVSYPKIVFLYPSFLASIAAGIYMLIAGQDAVGKAVEAGGRTDLYVVSMAFLAILAVNLVVLSFDFPRTTSLTLFFFFAAVAIGLWALFRFNPDLVPFVSGLLSKLNPLANSTFYFLFAGFMTLIYIGVAISVHFDYWEVRPNELLHHHGVLSDLKRYSAPNLRIDKEINDVFEYLLLRSGRLILHPSQERRAVVLENVFFINKREQEITQMLGAVQVQVRSNG